MLCIVLRATWTRRADALPRRRAEGYYSSRAGRDHAPQKWDNGGKAKEAYSKGGCRTSATEADAGNGGCLWGVHICTPKAPCFPAALWLKALSVTDVSLARACGINKCSGDYKQLTVPALPCRHLPGLIRGWYP